MNKKLLIIILVATVAGISLYGYLGGFNTPAISVTTSKTQFIAGKYFAGPSNAEQLGSLFREAAENLEQKKLKGSLANIYFNNPEKQTDSIKAFIGIMINDTTVALPAGYQLRQLSGGRKVVEASIRSHYLLAPKKLYPALFEYVKAQKLATEQIYLEIFPSESEALIQTEVTQ